MGRIKKTITTLILVIGFVHQSQAQKEYNKWYFGLGAGIDFNNVPPSSIPGSKMCTFESSTSICDVNGNLLFYTDGDTIYNRNNQKMLNWKSGMPNPVVNSAQQGSLALPVPGTDHLYFVFQGLSLENGQYNKDSMMRYLIVDMDGDGGLGEVILKNQPLFQGRFENFAVTRHANGSDYWVGSLDCQSEINTFNSKRTTNGQFVTPVMRQSLPAFSRNFGMIKFSPDSRTLYLRPLAKRENGNSYNNIYINLCRFDNSSGNVSDFLPILIGNESTTYWGAGNCEFSPNSKFLYLEELHGNKRCVYQYDISVWDSSAISASRVLIHSVDYKAPGYSGFTQFQLGPDGKIYCFQDSDPRFKNDRLSIINYPNIKGTGCAFTYRSLLLTVGTNNYGGPYYPSFWFKYPTIDLGRDTIICFGDSVQLKSNAQAGSVILWNMGDTTENIIVKAQGIYSVIVNTPFGVELRDTVMVKLGVKTKVFIGNDTAFCDKFTHLLKASNGFYKYKWNTGETDVQITVSSKGIYSVKVLDSHMCAASDSIFIDEIPRPVIRLSYDSFNCQYVYLSVDTLKGLTYRWNTGETKPNIKTTKKGWYAVKASHEFCSNMDSILVDKLGKPEVILGPDTSLCSSYIFLSTKEQGNYLWSTLQTTRSVLISQPGKYWLRISNGRCIAIDTIDVKPCENLSYFIPNSFTPNGDHINDVFKIYGSGIHDAEMEIFNRWGEKLLGAQGKDSFWDGTYKNEPCQESVYFYKVVLNGKKMGSAIFLTGSITLLR